MKQISQFFGGCKSNFNNIWVGMIKNGGDFSDHKTLKSGVSHKWFNKLTTLIEWFLHTDSDKIIFGLTTNQLCIFDT